jgi:hypothetical protein
MNVIIGIQKVFNRFVCGREETNVLTNGITKSGHLKFVS